MSDMSLLESSTSLNANNGHRTILSELILSRNEDERSSILVQNLFRQYVQEITEECPNLKSHISRIEKKNSEFLRSHTDRSKESSKLLKTDD